MTLGLYITIILAMIAILVGAIYRIVNAQEGGTIAAKIILHGSVLVMVIVSFFFFLPQACECSCPPCEECTPCPECTPCIECTPCPECTDCPECTECPDCTPCPTCPPDIAITNPRDGDIVPNPASVSGTITGEPDPDKYFWLLVNPQNSPSLYWPQDKPIEWYDGEWGGKVALGNEDTQGETFYIYVVSVNAQDNMALIENQNQGRETGSFAGIALPSSAEKLAKVAVVRD